MLNRNFMKVLVDFVHSKKPEFLMIGEMLHGDYTQLVNPELLDSVTNYECYKGLYSSFNTHNMHEIGYSLTVSLDQKNGRCTKDFHYIIL